jgi:hypothetical protein
MMIWKNRKDRVAHSSSSSHQQDKETERGYNVCTGRTTIAGVELVLLSASIPLRTKFNRPGALVQTYCPKYSGGRDRVSIRD